MNRSILSFLAVSSVLLLSACSFVPPYVPQYPPNPPRALTLQEWDAALLGTPSSGGLGATPTMSWPIPEWPASNTGTVYLEAKQPPNLVQTPKRSVGTVTREKLARATLPVTLEGDALVTPLETVRSFVLMYGESYATCTDSLVSSDTAPLSARVWLLAPNPFSGFKPASVQARNQPAPPFQWVLPFARSSNATQYLVFSTGIVTVKGELTCQSNNSDFKVDMRANLTLEPGWNGLTVRYLENPNPNSLQFRFVLEGDASGLTLEP